METAEITDLLTQWRAGDKEAEASLIDVVYGELRRLVRSQKRRACEGVTKQTTELINELYIKMVGQKAPEWQNRGHFFGIAAHQLRQVLVDEARSRRASKRNRPHYFEIDMALDKNTLKANIIDLDRALNELASLDPEQVRVVEYLYFAGFKQAEVAAALNVSVMTVRRRFNTAKAWLFHRLKTGRAVTL